MDTSHFIHDPKWSPSDLLKKAEQDDALAQYELGLYHLARSEALLDEIERNEPYAWVGYQPQQIEGIYIAQMNHKRAALYWLKRAAEQGYLFTPTDFPWSESESAGQS